MEMVFIEFLITLLAVSGVAAGIAASIASAVMLHRNRRRARHKVPWAVADALVCHSSTLYFLYNCLDGSTCWYGSGDGMFDVGDRQAFPFTLTHPDDREDLESCWEQAVMGYNEIPVVDIRIAGRGGQYRPCRCRLVPVGNGDAGPEKLLGCLINVEDLWDCIHTLEKERQSSKDTISVLSQSYSMITQIHIESGLCRCLRYDTPSFAPAGFFDPIGLDAAWRIPYPAYLKTLAENTVHRDFRKEFLHTFSEKSLKNFPENAYCRRSMALKIWDSENRNCRWAEAGLIPPVRPDGIATLFFHEINHEVTSGLWKHMAEEARKEAMQPSRPALKEEVFDMGQLMQSCQEYFHSLRRDKPISYMWFGTFGGKYIGDEGRLRQCLYSLLENAITFNRDGGRVKVKLERKPDEKEREYDLFRITVLDTGIGMTEAPAGTDLTVAKRIIEAMHGRIEIESELDKGTTVTIYFSLRRADTPSEGDEKS